MYVGSRIVEFIVDIEEYLLTNILTWDSLLTPTTRLWIACPSAYKVIMYDIGSIRSSCGIETSSGDFSKIKFSPPHQLEHQLYVYRHKKHMSYSHVTFTMLAKFCNIQEHKTYVKPCRKDPCHEKYLPYFYGNDQCNFLLGNMNLFDTFGDETSAGNYSEDDWTERLYHCLCLNKIEAELTAHFRGDQVK